MFEFRQITGNVILRKGLEPSHRGMLWMCGAMPFLFVKMSSGHYAHLTSDNKIDRHPEWRWDMLWLADTFRIVTHATVVSAVDIARETAKRLGVEVL